MEILCEFKYVQWEDKVIKYICFPSKSTVITRPHARVKAFVGTHLPGKDNTDIEAISFIDGRIEYIPKGISEIFPRLLCLEITNCGLKMITKKDLVGLENLQGIYLESNLLESIPSNLFMNMKKLHRVSFYGNKISSVTSKFFSPLISNDLTYLDFANNTKINSVFKPGSNCANTSSVHHLLNMIDSSCNIPLEDELSSNYVFMKEFSDGFQQLWNSERFSDFTITVGEKNFRVHKCVLGMKSEVFAKVFENKLAEYNKNKMEIPDFEASVVEQFLNFLYTGEMKDDAKFMVMDLFAISAKYDVTKLKDICEQMILENLDTSNALEVFGLGHAYNSDDMKLGAFTEIKSMFPEFDLADGFITKPEELRELIEAKRSYDSIIEKYKALNLKF